MTCDICGHSDRIDLAHRIPGYKEPAHYELFDCNNCRSMTVAPRLVDETVYDDMYANPALLAGCDRYLQLALRVRRVKEPLNFLAERMPVFWAVRDFVRSRDPGNTIEIGCGLGYLTFALRHSGINIVGTDISQNAVDAASDRYGPFYRKASVDDLLKTSERFDTIIMTEVIEHLEHPFEVLRSLVKLLNRGGTIFLTTPNRDFFPKDAIWKTDLPPVHLWWFSERSLQAIAQRLNCQMHLMDFNSYNLKYPTIVKYMGLSKSSLNVSGKPIQQENGAVKILRRLGMLHDVYRAICFVCGALGYRPFDQSTSKRSSILAVSLTRA